MAGIIEKMFSKTIAKATASAVAVQINDIAAQINARASATAYNRSVFSWLNAGEIILNPDYFDYVRAYENTGAVYECVDLIMKKVIASPRIVYRIKDKEGYKTFKNLQKSDNIVDKAKATKMRSSVLEEVKVKEIDALLKQPNDKQNGNDFIEMLTGNYLIRGNAFIYANSPNNKTKKWSEMFAMPSDMHIVSGGIFEPIKSYFLHWGTPEEEYFPADQIKHIKTFNPRYSITASQLYGMSPLRPYLYAIDKIKNGNKQADKQLKNGGKMGFVAPKNKEDELGIDQKDGLHESIVEAHSSDGAMARIIPSSIPLDWTEIGLDSSDMQLLEHLNASADDIYRAYHVPLYFRSLESATYNNVTTAKKQLIYDAVAPVADKISAALTEFICTPYLKEGLEYVIYIDYMSLPELSDDVKMLADFLEKMWMLTPNQKLEVMGFGRSEQDGMDEVFLNRNMVRLQDVMDGKIQNTSQGQVDNQNQSDNSLV